MKTIAPKTTLVEDALKQGTYNIRDAWYLNLKVLRPKTQYKWTLYERSLLYQMRVVQHKSIREIQEYFRKMNSIPTGLDVDDPNDKFSRTRLHNQIRLIRGSFQCLCHSCRKKLTRHDYKRMNLKERKNRSIVLCQECFEKASNYKKTKRLSAIERGVCGVCEKNEIIEGHTLCKACISSTQRYRYIDGKCGQCGKNPIAPSSIALCKSCLTKNREYSRMYLKKKRAERRVNGKKKCTCHHSR